MHRPSLLHSFSFPVLLHVHHTAVHSFLVRSASQQRGRRQELLMPPDTSSRHCANAVKHPPHITLHIHQFLKQDHQVSRVMCPPSNQTTPIIPSSRDSGFACWQMSLFLEMDFLRMAWIPQCSSLDSRLPSFSHLHHEAAQRDLAHLFILQEPEFSLDHECAQRSQSFILQHPG